MKKKLSRMKLSRETLRHLDDSSVAGVAGGIVTVRAPCSQGDSVDVCCTDACTGSCPQSCRFICPL